MKNHIRISFAALALFTFAGCESTDDRAVVTSTTTESTEVREMRPTSSTTETRVIQAQ